MPIQSLNMPSHRSHSPQQVSSSHQETCIPMPPALSQYRRNGRDASSIPFLLSEEEATLPLARYIDDTARLKAMFVTPKHQNYAQTHHPKYLISPHHTR
ncbi:hypothetical protein AZE42_10975 [Rhizopogon vesiculosus]|uniref:Uncharacterized protein n=1 Tax=Rhizopogon vesiculosus TaxID=180088 RepID=A0A1J8QT59_9AGAM|nr:hypothetical protein AZE42_10975 [Rhizopogon vesiculosus]